LSLRRNLLLLKESILHSKIAQHNAAFPNQRLPGAPSILMHIIVIAWLYVALMMALAEGTHSTGTVVGAIFTFLLYGVGPVALVVYLMNAPARRRRIKEREVAQQQAAREAALRTKPSNGGIVEPDAGCEPSADPVAPMRKET
jgi:heme exporter protein D